MKVFFLWQLTGLCMMSFATKDNWANHDKFYQTNLFSKTLAKGQPKNVKHRGDAELRSTL